MCPTCGRWALVVRHDCYIGTHDLADPMDLIWAHGRPHLDRAPFPVCLNEWIHIRCVNNQPGQVFRSSVWQRLPDRAKMRQWRSRNCTLKLLKFSNRTLYRHFLEGKIIQKLKLVILCMLSYLSLQLDKSHAARKVWDKAEIHLPNVLVFLAFAYCPSKKWQKRALNSFREKQGSKRRRQHLHKMVSRWPVRLR